MKRPPPPSNNMQSQNRKKDATDKNNFKLQQSVHAPKFMAKKQSRISEEQPEKT